jgi:hypothetical protein
LLLARIDDSGQFRWLSEYNASPVTFGSNAFAIDGLGRYTMCSESGYIDFFAARTEPDSLWDSVTSSRNPSVPSALDLSAFPNPFNPSTEITITLPISSQVSLKMHNVLGREVAVLAEGSMTAGQHSIKLDGSLLPTGIYFCRLNGAQMQKTIKVVLLR